ncbi:MAG: aminoacyl-tRNA hydrolase [Clostridiales bacterium]|nr:aminoacyl-tRNA hydrolase [Clostridiales bacterium]
MKLIVGLGNPEDSYRDTYHNVGFCAADILAARFNAPAFAYDKKSNADLTDFSCGGEKILLCKPQTYMNLSGDAVSYLARYYKIAPADILVMYDDIDIPKGTIRAREQGSSGTHNGMRDILAKLGTQAFKRVRIGIGFRPNYMALADYVLSHIPAVEKPFMQKAFAAAADYAEDFANGKPWQELTVTISN